MSVGRVRPFPIAFYDDSRHNARVAGCDERPMEPVNDTRPDGAADLRAAVVAALAGLIAAWVAAGSTACSRIRFAGH